MAIKAKLEQALASDTAYGEPEELTTVVCGVDIRGSQVQIVGVGV